MFPAMFLHFVFSPVCPDLKEVGLFRVWSSHYRWWKARAWFFFLQGKIKWNKVFSYQLSYNKFNTRLLIKLHVNDQIEFYTKIHSCCLTPKIIYFLLLFFGFYHGSWKSNFQVHGTFPFLISFHKLICSFYFTGIKLHLNGCPLKEGSLN